MVGGLNDKGRKAQTAKVGTGFLEKDQERIGNRVMAESFQNKLGVLTNLEVTINNGGVRGIDGSRLYFPSYANSYAVIQPTIELDLRDGGIKLNSYLQSVGKLFEEPTYQREWACLYCASPNKIERTHCKQCGAPRSWIFG